MNYFGSPSREKGFTMAADIYRRNQGRVIVETGCMWNPPQGQSTLFFADLARTTNGLLHSVDLNPEHIDAARRAVGDTWLVWFHCEDSIDYLSRYHGEPIDLLYIDAFDYDVFYPKVLGAFNAAEIGAALGKMASRSCILLDDWNYGQGEWIKCALSRELLLYRGWKLVNEDYQLLFER